jgi:hypothetical protein
VKESAAKLRRFAFDVIFRSIKIIIGHMPTSINITTMSEVIVTEEKVKKKRGRKPSKERKGYFYEREEQAVVDYISTDDEREKNRIFNEILKPAFTKMVESIIRRYNLYPPDEEFQETFDDTISFLMTKLSCFKPESGYKAYSYCGTICKNYLYYKINQFIKNQKRNTSYDNPFDSTKGGFDDDIRYSYNDSDTGRTFIAELTGSTVDNIKKILDDAERMKLNENEIKVGQALVNLMTNWEELFAQMGSDKFNKSSILLFLKETTMLNTKEIRDAMRVYKKKYYDLKWTLINE